MIHEKTYHKFPSTSFARVKRQRINTRTVTPRQERDALNFFKIIVIPPEEKNRFDLSVFLQSIKSELIDRIEHEVEEKGAIKWQLIVKLTMVKNLSTKKMKQFNAISTRACIYN